MDKLVISVVSYFNALPFRHELLKYANTNNWEIQTDIPSVCADKLISGTADIGLIPVAEIERIPNANIIGDYCIAADGEVKSVLLLSEVPLQEIKTILLDYQSRTSVRLCKILAENFWKINPVWENTLPGYENQIQANTAAVVIGDRAIEKAKDYKYAYDLSAEWKKHTDLPFVFACWVANKKIDEAHVLLFNKAIEQGVLNREQILDEENITNKESRNYILNVIKYKMDASYRDGLSRFFSLSESPQQLH